MRGLIILIIVAFAGYSGWWWIGRTAQVEGFARWKATQQQAGWQVDVGDMSVSGYPSRFDTRLRDLALAPASREWIWRADGFDIYALSYKPNHLILAWPGIQHLSLQGRELALEADVARASAVMMPNLRLTLNRFQFEGKDLAIRADGQPLVKVAQAGVSIHHSGEDTAPTYDLYLQVVEAAMPEVLQSLLGDADPRRAAPVTLRVDADLTLDAPLDRTLQTTGVEAVDVVQAELLWGSQRIAAMGRVQAGTDGSAEGALDLEFSDWPAFLELLQRGGLLSPTMAQVLLNGFGKPANGSIAGAIRLDLRQGQVFLGPVVLGPAPRLGR